MTKKRFELRLCSNGRYYLYKNNDLIMPYVDFNKFNKESADAIVTALNMLIDENEQLKQSIQEYKEILQDMGILMSDEDVVNIRNDIADKLLKPLFKSNGFDVDIDTTDGFTIIPKGDVE